MVDSSPKLKWPLITGTLLVLVRGILLWVVVPLGAAVWLIFWPYWHFKKIGVRQLLGWVDLNLVAALQRSIFRPVCFNPLSMINWRDIGEVTHRVTILDPL